MLLAVPDLIQMEQNAEQIAAIRQDVALIKAQTTRLEVMAAENRRFLDEMPKSYVPRSEHDLRDQQRNYTGQIAELRSDINAIRTQMNSDKNDVYKAIFGITLALLGGGALGAYGMKKVGQKDDTKAE